MKEGPLGKGWGHNYEVRLDLQATTDIITVHWSANRYNTFIHDGWGNCTSPDRACRIDSLSVSDDGCTLTRKDQSQYIFDSNGILVQINTGHGQQLNLGYDGSDRL